MSTERRMNLDTLHAILAATFRTNQVLVRIENNGFYIESAEPVTEKPKFSSRLYGMLADYPEMSVEKFLERKHADQELDL
jgi:hypothetical protein